MRSWLTALRLARRELRRSKGRSALVVILIGLPVLAFAFVAVSYDTFQLRGGERADRKMGRADLLVDSLYAEPIRQDPLDLLPYGGSEERKVTADDVLAVLPAGARIVPLRHGQENLKTAGGTGRVPTLTVAAADPVVAGMVTVLDGRVPAGTGELAVTRAAADRLGVGTGGTVVRPDGTTLGRVVGLIEMPDGIDNQLVVRYPGPADFTAPGDGNQWLVDTPAPVTWPAVWKLNQQGVLALSRAVLTDPPAHDAATMPPKDDDNDQAIIGAMLGAVLVLEVVLLVGPAFAVSARRRRRDLALVAAAGGSPAQLRRIVLADGVVLGSVAAGCGLLLGVVAAVVSRELVAEQVMHRRPGEFRVFPVALVGLAALAVGAGVLAALVPAVTAARQPVVAALAGRFATGRLRRRWAVLGLALMAIGVAGTAYGTSRAGTAPPDATGQAGTGLAVAGMVIAELGLVLCTPALVGLVAGLAGRLPLGPRISLRDIGRNRASAAPAISAVLAAVAMGTLSAALLAGDELKWQNQGGRDAVPAGYAALTPYEYTAGPDGERPPPPTAQQYAAVTDAIRATLPATEVVPIGAPQCPASAPGTCQLRLDRPAANRCPYLSDHPTTAQQRKANADPRCAPLDAVAGSFAMLTVVVDPKDLPALVDLDPAELADAEATLRAGGILTRESLALTGDSVTVAIPDPAMPGYYDERHLGEAPPGRRVTLPARLLPADGAGPSLVLSPATAARLDLPVAQSGLVAATSRLPTQGEEDALTAALAGTGRWDLAVNRPTEVRTNLSLVLLAVAAGVVTVAAAAIAAGLAAAESRTDLVTLAAVGAGPGIRRTLTLSRTGLIAGLGSALGLAAGLAATFVVVTGEAAAVADEWPQVNPSTPFVVPWSSVIVSVVVAPLVAMLGAALFTRARLPAERRAAG